MNRIIEELEFWVRQLNDPERFEKYTEEIIVNEDVRTEGWQLGYMTENIKIAEMIPKDKIVIDVGCGFGFQHILFKDHKKYIGIQAFRIGKNKFSDKPIELKVFTDNATIIQKEFKDISAVEIGWNVENKNDFFGIANHSLWHDPSENAEDIQIFKN